MPIGRSVKQRAFFSLIFGFALYSFYVYTSGTTETADRVSISQAGESGRLLYQKYNCTACHQFYGMGGYLGPDLTNVMSAPGKGDLYVRALLKVGTDVMPNYDLPETEIDALVAYLTYVDQTGRFPEPAARKTWYGSIEIDD